jgi:hypothetical protein
MISSEHGRITIELCSGVVPNATTMAILGMHGDMPDHGKSQDPGNAEMPCAFAGLSAATLGAVDPVQLITLMPSSWRSGCHQPSNRRRSAAATFGLCFEGPRPPFY